MSNPLRRRRTTARRTPLRVRASSALVAILVAVSAAACSPHGGPAPAASTAPQPHRDAPEAALSTLRAIPQDAGIKVRRYHYATPGRSDPRQNWMDLYLPAPADGHATEHSVPLVILIHGGSWLDRIGAGTMGPFARHLAERGLAVLNLEYRRVGDGGGWPTTFTDVAGALDTVPDIEREVPQLNPNDAVVVGHSAGAQLAVWAGTRQRLSPGEVGAGAVFHPRHVISLAGPLDMQRAVALGDRAIVRAMGGTPRQHRDRYATVDPIENINPAASVVAVAGTADRIVPYQLSEDYVNAARSRGGDARAVILPGVTHTSIIAPGSAAFREVVELIVRETVDAHEATP